MRPLFFVAASLLLLASAARADLKTVARLTVSGLPGSEVPAPQVITTFYKGESVRTESGSGAVLLRDAVRDRLYTLNAPSKTYTATRPGQTSTGDGPLAGLLAMVSLDAKVFVKSGGETRTIAGHAAIKHRYTVFVTVRPKAGAPPGIAALLPTIKIEGEQWNAEGIAAPLAPAPPAAANPLLQTGLKPLWERLARLKGLPLLSKTTTTITMPAEAGSLGAGLLPTQPLVATTELIEISDAPLSDDLFAVPSDYKLEENHDAPDKKTP